MLTVGYETSQQEKMEFILPEWQTSWKIWLQLLHVISRDSVYYASKSQHCFAKDLANKKRDLLYHSHQFYETFSLNFYNLVCLIQFSMFVNVRVGSKKVSGEKNGIDVAMVITLMKNFIWIVTC